jgi:hypothetical protein
MASLLVNVLISLLLFSICFIVLYKSWDRAIQPWLEKTVVTLRNWSGQGPVRLPDDENEGIEEQRDGGEGGATGAMLEDPRRV